MTTREYEKHLEQKMIRDFQEAFLQKIGKKVFVSVESPGKAQGHIPSLAKLRRIVNQYIPRGKGLPRTIEDKSRKKELATLRHIFCYLAWQYDYSLTEIGHMIGSRDHTTVIHSRDRLQDKLDVKDAYVLKYYQKVLNKIKHDNGLHDASSPKEGDSQPAIPAAVL